MDILLVKMVVLEVQEAEQVVTYHTLEEQEIHLQLVHLREIMQEVEVEPHSAVFKVQVVVAVDKVELEEMQTQVLVEQAV